MSAEPVFVYGTLKRGFPNHVIGMQRFRFLGRHRTVERYPLVLGGRWYTPVLLDEPGQGHRVVGELYRVDAAGVAMLDDFEDVGRPRGYKRLQISIEPIASGTTLQAWAYLKQRADVAGIRSAPMTEYRLDARYVVPWQR